MGLPAAERAVADTFFFGARRRRSPSAGVLPPQQLRRVAHLAAARAVAWFGAH